MLSCVGFNPLQTGVAYLYPLTQYDDGYVKYITPKQYLKENSWKS